MGENWGGKREGSGRPSADEKKINVSCSLTEMEIYALDSIAKKAGVSRSAAVGLMINSFYAIQKAI